MKGESAKVMTNPVFAELHGAQVIAIQISFRSFRLSKQEHGQPEAKGERKEREGQKRQKKV